MTMSRTRRPRRASRPRPPRREQTPWAVTVLGATVGGAARAVFTWLLDLFSN
ncbi:hypothetical protein [Streptomyces yangpuensis]|uniref:hypothetical protein n=1 Tax=Streptomyces yangpuensis TaxID=1648182 RepID=UPI00381A225E